MVSSAKDLQLRELKDTVSQLKTMVSEQTKLIKSLRLVINDKASREKTFQEQLDYLIKKLFGSSSERRSDGIPGQQNLFNEVGVEHGPSLLEEETVIRGHTCKKKATHAELFKGLPVKKVVIHLPEDEQICSACGTQVVLIEEEYVRRELEFIPAKCKVIEYYSQNLWLSVL
ncbi:IS66 family transposase zinc-finger binding domain-containing protein [Parablautia muri]|uniref:IS66 family transposase zinc-finger binding domain-containing protein n=1 Tax=Parablautia muri TaxID=2320879 RepID=UPI0024127630|nr:IS66 family transposase zinc-finger binding domain-containing protein [Parablautia muri]